MSGLKASDKRSATVDSDRIPRFNSASSGDGRSVPRFVSMYFGGPPRRCGQAPHETMPRKASSLSIGATPARNPFMTVTRTHQDRNQSFVVA